MTALWLLWAVLAVCVTRGVVRMVRAVRETAERPVGELRYTQAEYDEARVAAWKEGYGTGRVVERRTGHLLDMPVVGIPLDALLNGDVPSLLRERGVF